MEIVVRHVKLKFNFHLRTRGLGWKMAQKWWKIAADIKENFEDAEMWSHSTITQNKFCPYKKPTFLLKTTKANAMNK